MSKIYKRKKFNYSVKRKMQLRLLLKVVTILLVGVMISTLVFYFYSNREVGYTYKMVHIKARNFLDFLLPAVIMSFVVSVMVGGAIALFFPNTIAGPLYRIEKELDRLSDGDFTLNIKLRKGDEVVDLADKINFVSKKLAGKIRTINKIAYEICDVVGSKYQNDNKLRDLCARLETELDKFNIE